MSYLEELVIGNGVTSQNLIAGPDAAGGSALTIVVESGGALDGVNQVLTGGDLIVSDGGAAYNVYANTADGDANHSGILLDGGTLEGGSACGTGDVALGALGVVRSGGVLSNFTLTTDNATGANRTWFWVGKAAGDGAGTAREVTVEKMARLQVQLTGKAYDTNVISGGTMYLYHTAVAEDTVISGAYNGNRAQIFVNAAGNELRRTRILDSGAAYFTAGKHTDTVVGSGGYLGGVYGVSATNLVAEAGATVDLSYNSNTSGMMLRGTSTAIAEGTLRYNGTLLNGAAAAGVLSNVSGAAAWRFNIGEELTVENAKLTSGTRIYAHETAVVSSSVILTSGNISLLENTVGRDITVGGAGEIFANCNVFDNASAYDTVVYEGGFFRTRNEGSIASGVTVYSGGSALGWGGLMEDVRVEDGGHLHVSAGASATNVWLNAVAATDATDFNLLVAGGTVEGGSACGDGGKWAVTGVVCSGGVLSNFTLTTKNYSTALPTWFWIGKANGDGGGLARDITITVGAKLQVQQNGVAENLNMNLGELVVMQGGTASSVTGVNRCAVTINNGGSLVNADLTNCRQTFNAGATVRNVKLTTPNTAPVIAAGANVDGVEIVSGTLTVDAGVTVRNLTMKTQATGTNSLIVNGTVIGGSGVGLGGVTNAFRFAVSSGGVLSDFTLADGTADYQARGWVYTGGTVRNIVIGSKGHLQLDGRTAGSTPVVSGAVIMAGGTGLAWYGDFYDADIRGYLQLFTNGSVSGAVIRDGGKIDVTAANTNAENVVIDNGGYMYFNNDTADADNLVIHSGGVLSNYVNGTINDLTVSAGGRWICEWDYYAARVEGTVTLDLTGVKGEDTALAERSFNALAASRVVKASEEIGNYEYKLLASGGALANAFTLDIGGGNTYATDNTTADIIDPLTRMSYSRQIDDEALKLVTTVDTSRVISAVASAAALATSGSTLNGSDREARWTNETGVTSGNIYLADGMTTGNAWLELNGYDGGTATTLYGARGSAFAFGAVNILAKSGSLRNLAAGADAGGTVKAVNLSFDGAELDGTGYAGGFGNVTGKTATTITTGTFAKDFYAGALANKLTTTTSVGDVAMTVAGGTFDGNIFGASAVKTDSTKGNGTRHTVGDVTLTVTNGEATKSNFCAFAGGYATGDATGTVYKVDSVTLDISGGDWGDAHGGRGVFGGVMASGVEAQVVGDVNITISGNATMGNLYGGGWAQKTNGKSIVGDVNINIAGGTIANVFGGGSHSTTGGATTAGNVTITVSGGSITGSIFARGQLDGDTTGTAGVIFTGATDFGCDVFGYSYVGGAAGNATLSYTGYTGEFSGKLGGFDGITLDGATAMELTTAAADVSNTRWEFDLTDRASTLAGTSLLTWSAADFENDTIKVTFADDTQAQGGWNIAAVTEAFAGATFDVEVGGQEIATGLAYGDHIADGEYKDWGFTLDSGVLKFKNLA